MKIRKVKGDQRGFTLAELMICMSILMMVIIPVAFSFRNSTYNLATANRTEVAIKNAEELLAQIKQKMSQDIMDEQKIEGKALKYAGGSAAEIRYTSIAKPYLQGEAVYGTPVALEDFLAIDSADLSAWEATHDFTKYSYEVMIWNVEKASDLLQAGPSAGTKVLTLDSNALSKAYTFNTDSAYPCSSAMYTSMNKPITFTITDEMYKTLVDSEKRYLPQFNKSSVQAVDKYDIADLCKLNLSDTFELESPAYTALEGVMKLSPIYEIEGHDTSKKGYCIYINNGLTSYTSPTSGAKPINIIDVDLSKFLWDVTATSRTENTSYDTYTLKFINKTNIDQIIRVKRSGADDMSWDQIDKKINIVLEQDDTVASVGNMTIERVDQFVPYTNYMIAIIVRDKNPLVGQPGKIVKKLFEVYSYDPQTYERW